MFGTLKRGLAALVCACMMTVMLVACGGDGSSSGSQGGAGSSGSTGGASGSASGGGSGEMVTVKVGYGLDPTLEFQGGETIESNSWTDLYAENGIKLEIVYNVESTQKDEKLAQMIMSGDYPDFMNVSNAYFLDWAKQGVFLDLAPYFDEYASDLTKAYYQTEYGKKALDSATVDGKLYALPAASAGYDGLPVLWIRQDWLDNLNMEVPKTTEQFYELAKAFTEQDPDGNGQDDTYGLVLNGKDVFSDNGGLDQFFQMFGAVPGIVGSTITFIDNGGQAVYGGSLIEESKAALTMLNDMYNNGYIPRDFVTAGADQVNQQLAAGSAGMVISRMYCMGTPWKDALATQPNAEFIAAVLPGVTEAQMGQSFYTSTPAGFYCLNSGSEDLIEQYFTIINLGVAYLAQPDTLSQEDYEKYNGKAGQYTGWQLCLATYGNPIKNLEALPKHQNAIATGDTSALNAENLRDYNAMQDYVQNKDRRDELNETELAAFDSGLFFWSVWGAPKCSYAAIDEMIKLGNISFSAYDAPLTDAMIEHSTTLDTLAKETIIDIVNGNRPVDYYDEFIETWNSLGGAEITAEANEWYQSVK